jgi:MerR family transcriptional regulator/heat shock protein HspR
VFKGRFRFQVPSPKALKPARSQDSMDNRPVFPISVVSELINVHPETLRVWEKKGVIKPRRRSGRRFYSETDLKRLRFIQKLISEDLNLPAIRHYLRLYPCWQLDSCPACMHRTELEVCAKPCWQEEGTYCQVYGDEDTCAQCEFRLQKNR